MAGIIGSYTTVPRLATLNGLKTIESDGVDNPVDLGQVSLANIRGQLFVMITASDTGHSAFLKITGGFGEFQDSYTRNWYFQGNTNMGCTVSTPVTNTIRITTPASDAGGRVYDLIFSPIQSIGPTIEQTSVNVLGTADLTVNMQTQTPVQGGF